MPQTAQSPRDAQKARYQDYQARARVLAQTVNRVLDKTVVEVSTSPTVWEVDDGAFVKAIVWVPREGERP